MTFSRAPLLRTTVRAVHQQTARRQPLLSVQRRFVSSGTGPKEPAPAGPTQGIKGMAKEYNKDGTNPNKNLVYIGAGVLGLGGVYAMYISRTPEKATERANERQ
ncbi:hypothetical protein B0T26DRAFT_755330 [Lasiosphaeria miniovina]|uniref:Uncharacterized protein n=1 Tax=Lasiosphaeria miniovina TaxID=1954250 RepID=A0AA40DNY6_9PEZI|nr:uncharacterized protein B0T26DRAFT_755330 [Lasiosphaeria miniovina]KAK0710240.1 hypothetical protein B0T26DRAFT_755330 [Lasiosphaeria miniovina]